jgi:hypothetical protein
LFQAEHFPRESFEPYYGERCLRIFWLILSCFPLPFALLWSLAWVASEALNNYSFIAGENGLEGTGDLSKPYNLARFVSFVRESTNNRGVHFATASGVSNYFTLKWTN